MALFVIATLFGALSGLVIALYVSGEETRARREFYEKHGIEYYGQKKRRK